jgi:hypothetical protein
VSQLLPQTVFKVKHLRRPPCTRLVACHARARCAALQSSCGPLRAPPVAPAVCLIVTLLVALPAWPASLALPVPRRLCRWRM